MLSTTIANSDGHVGKNNARVPDGLVLHQTDELSRKILRSLSDTSKRLDEQLRKCQSVTQFFSKAELLDLRVRFRSLVQKLVSSELCGGQLSKSSLNAVEMEWKKISYEPISAAKKWKKHRPVDEWSMDEQCQLQGHILNGIGHYQNFLMWLEEFSAASSRQAESSSPLVRTDFAIVKPFKSGPNKADAPSCLSDATLELIIHRCLMSLGDLTRYHLDLLPSDERSGMRTIAQRYYHQALMLQPNNGLPFNLLATLSIDQNSGFNAVFYYLRSLTSLTLKEQVEGVETNLRRFFDKKDFSEILSSENDENHQTGNGNDAESAILHFIYLIREFLFEDSTGHLQQVCQVTLKWIQRCLTIPQTADELNTNKLSKEVSSKMVLAILLLITRLNDQAQDKKVSILRAFMFALYLHLVSKLLADIHLSFSGHESMLNILSQNKMEDIVTVDEVSAKVEATDELTNGNGDSKLSQGEGDQVNAEAVKSCDKPKRPKNIFDQLRRRRRPRRRGDVSSDSENESDEISRDESDEENESSDDEDSDVIPANELLDFDSFDDDSQLDTDDEEEEDDDDEDVIIESCKEIISVDELINFFVDHPLAEAVRLCSLWLMSSRGLLKEAGSTADILWIRLYQLFNAIRVEKEKSKFDIHDDFLASMSKCQQNMSTKPLPEDFLSRGMKIFDDWQKQMRWNEPEIMTSQDEGMYRLLHLLDFRDWLINAPEVGLSINPSTGSVDLKKPQGAAGVKVEKKLNMMQNMAQLWLQQEVRELEGTDSGNGSAGGGLVLVDHLALIRHLSYVREIVDSKRFVVIVPIAVVQLLDGVKKQETGARNAIRWLEREFKEGNRWLRPQKKDESRTLEGEAYPSKRDKYRLSYFKVLECCNFFAVDSSGKSLAAITLLTAASKDGGTNEHETIFNVDENGIVSIRDVAQNFNIRLEEVTKFAERFKLIPSKKHRMRYRQQQQQQQQRGKHQHHDGQRRHDGRRYRMRKDDG